MHKTNYFPCRCKRKNECSYRVTLRRHPDEYVRTPKCKNCSGPLIVDNYRKQRKDSVFDTCYCAATAGRDGANMPHRRGSLVMCEHFRMPF